MADVAIILNGGAPVRHALAEVSTFGRSSECGICIADSNISREHCKLERTDAGWLLTDLGSTNGTYVNGRRVIAPTSLRRGDTIQVGKTVMEVR